MLNRSPLNIEHCWHISCIETTAQCLGVLYLLIYFVHHRNMRHPLQSEARLDNFIQVLLELRAVNLASVFQFVVQHFAVADDRVERCA